MMVLERSMSEVWRVFCTIGLWLYGREKMFEKEGEEEGFGTCVCVCMLWDKSKIKGSQALVGLQCLGLKQLSPTKKKPIQISLIP